MAAGEKGSEDGRSDVPGRTGEDDSHPVIVGTAADSEGRSAEDLARDPAPSHRQRNVFFNS